jgi:hypothetical protein
LEWAWNNFPWGKKDGDGDVMDQAWFCSQVTATNKLEFLKWAREVKQCEWDEWPINTAAAKGNLEMLKYCFSNDCPYDEEASCKQAAARGHLDCVRFLSDQVKPSRDTEEEAAHQAAGKGCTDIMKYFVEERKISDAVKFACVATAARHDRLDCLKYLVEEAKAPLTDWRLVANARYFEHPGLRKLLARKRVSRTNRRAIRLVYRGGAEKIKSVSEREKEKEKEKERHFPCATHTHFWYSNFAIFCASVVFLIFFSLDFFSSSFWRRQSTHLSAERDEKSENVWRRF